jgi:hypothetical protein
MATLSLLQATSLNMWARVYYAYLQYSDAESARVDDAGSPANVAEDCDVPANMVRDYAALSTLHGPMKAMGLHSVFIKVARDYA